ncbi:MAG: hypothetical protein LUD72_02940 [Bacteroidales bacterium]|nr:hypothetical protein [Bacteroidales bacterium]
MMVATIITGLFLILAMFLSLLFAGSTQDHNFGLEIWFIALAFLLMEAMKGI